VRTEGLREDDEGKKPTKPTYRIWIVCSSIAPRRRSSSVLLLEIVLSGLRFEDEISKTARRRRHFVAMHYVPDLNKINLACASCHHGGNVSVSGSSADSPDTCL
jgi:hypothetical protein